MTCFKHIRAFLCVGAAFSALPALAEAPPLSAYGDLPGIEDMAISPNGEGLAIATTIKGERQMVVFDGQRKLRGKVGLADSKLRSIRFAGEDMVLVSTSQTEDYGAVETQKIEFMRTTIVPLTGGEIELLFKRNRMIAPTTAGSYGLRQVDGKWIGYFGGLELERGAGGTSYTLMDGRPHLYAVDLAANKPAEVGRAGLPGHSRGWMIDGEGTVAVIFDLEISSGDWSITDGNGRAIVSGNDPTGGIGVIAFGPDGNSVIYGLENDDDDTWELFSAPLAGGASEPFLKDVDVERFYVDRGNGRLLGYLDEASGKPVMFDKGQQATLEKVYQAFPDLKVSISEWTRDFSHILVRTAGNGDSGSWYVVDMQQMKADPVGYERMQIGPEDVGPISTVTYTAADGLEIEGILTLPPGREAKNLPVVLLPHGGPHAHDSATFDWWAQAFASRGYAVFQPNFRGSTNKDLAFRKAGYREWGGKMQSDLSDGLKALADRGIVDPKRACIMGASYGGYAALAGVTLQQGLYRCSVAVAPVSDLKAMYYTQLNKGGRNRMLRGNLSEDLGPPETLDAVSPLRFADRADAPVMVIHGKDDTVVPFAQGKDMADALKAAGKPAELVVLEDEDHWLSRGPTRLKMLSEALRWVQTYNPAD